MLAALSRPHPPLSPRAWLYLSGLGSLRLLFFGQPGSGQDLQTRARGIRPQSRSAWPVGLRLGAAGFLCTSLCLLCSVTVHRDSSGSCPMARLHSRRMIAGTACLLSFLGIGPPRQSGCLAALTNAPPRIPAYSHARIARIFAPMLRSPLVTRRCYNQHHHLRPE